MEEAKNILFASNLSKEMKIVFEHAATTAVYHKSRIIVVHVMEKNDRSRKRMKTAFGEKLYEDLKSEHRQEARNILTGKNVDALKIRQAIAGFFEENTSGDNAAGLISKIRVTESRGIADEIAAIAVEENCGMIVMGCKQQGLMAEATGDNVVRKVLKRTSVPVLMVPLRK